MSAIRRPLAPEIRTDALITEFRAALRGEAAVQRIVARAHPLRLFDGVRTPLGRGGYANQFWFARPPHAVLDREERAACIVGTREVVAVVRAVEEHMVLIEFMGVMPDRIPEAVLFQNAGRYTEALSERLRWLGWPGATPQWREEWARAALVPGAHERLAAVQPPPVRTDVLAARRLRSETSVGTGFAGIRPWLDTALSRPTSVLLTPPAEARREIVACVASCLALSRQRVLVATPDNPEADLVDAETCDWLSDHPDLYRGLVRRGADPHYWSELHAWGMRDLPSSESGATQHASEYDDPEVRLIEEERCALARGDAQRVQDCQEQRLKLWRDGGSHASPSVDAAVTIASVKHLWLSRRSWQHYNAVVVSDASRTSAPALFLVAGLARTRLVLIADRAAGAKPAFQNDDPNPNWILATDPLEIAGIRRSVAAESCPSHVSFSPEA